MFAMNLSDLPFDVTVAIFGNVREIRREFHRRIIFPCPNLPQILELDQNGRMSRPIGKLSCAKPLSYKLLKKYVVDAKKKHQRRPIYRQIRRELR